MKTYWFWIVGVTCLALGGCHWDMWVQSKSKPQELSPYWANISNNPSSTRMPLTGTIPFNGVRKDAAFYTGFEAGKIVKEFPIPVTKELIARGRERFTIFCSHCHGQLGDGKGMINQRGFKLARPVATYHTSRLRQMPVGHFFDVITTGFGAMYPQAARISPHDRWAIASYIRVLQFSQYAPIADVDSVEIRSQLGSAATSAPSNSGPIFVSPAQEPTTWPPKASGQSGADAAPAGDKVIEAPVAGQRTTIKAQGVLR